MATTAATASSTTLQSMTGFSRVSKQTPLGTITVELRSTNHRYLEVDPRMPDGFNGFEGELVQLIRGLVRRGRIEATVSVQAGRAGGKRIQFDEGLADSYYQALQQVKQRFGLRGDVTLEQLLSYPSILTMKDERSRRQELWPAIQQTTQAAVQQLLVMRRSEGKRLVKDLRSLLESISKRVKGIRTQLPKQVTAQRRRLGDRLKSLLGSSVKLTTGQIHEALTLLKDIDVHEELIRLESHLEHMRQAFSGREAVGKKLDFIGQELMREANTLGAKANDAQIVQWCIEIKGAIEKIREQAQNLE